MRCKAFVDVKGKENLISRTSRARSNEKRAASFLAFALARAPGRGEAGGGEREQTFSRPFHQELDCNLLCSLRN